MKIFGIEITRSKDSDEYYDVAEALKKFGSLNKLADRVEEIQNGPTEGLYGLKLSSPPNQTDLMLRLTLDRGKPTGKGRQHGFVHKVSQLQGRVNRSRPSL